MEVIHKIGRRKTSVARVYMSEGKGNITVNKEWVLVDASELPLGRTASIVAKLLRGKHKTNFTPHVDCGDNVVVINAEKVSLSGDKWSQKQYISHTGYPGGQRIITADKLHKKNNIKLVEKAVKGMLPKNKLGADLFRNLKVFPGSEHDHEAQKPKPIDVNSII